MKKPEEFKILFIYPNMHTPYSFSPAIQLLSAVLKKRGYKTDLIHVHEEYGVPLKKEEILKLVKAKEPDLISITSTTFEYKEADEIARMIKEGGIKAKVILGGTHATIMPYDLETSHFDGFCIGEGEKALVRLSEKLRNDENYLDTKSFWFKTDKGIIKNELYPFIKDLDELPAYDMEIMDTKKLLKLRSGWLSISFSRGCPYNCTFCINPLLKNIKNIGNSNVKEYLRKKSVKKTIWELKSIAQKYRENIVVFNFDDDLLMLFREWILKFCELYKIEIYKKYKIQYAINCRVNTIDDQIAKKLAESGCRELRIGVETANDYLRNEVIKKGIAKEQIINAFRLCDKYGIKSNAFMMIGIPGENEGTINETFDFVFEIKPNLIRLTFLQPYIGTEIYNYCKKDNLFKDNSTVDCFTESPLKFINISDEKLLKFKVLFPWHVNLRDEKIRSIYQKAIKEFEDLSYQEFLKSFNKILEKDLKLSEELTKKNIPHFGYFNKNTYYFELKCKQ